MPVRRPRRTKPKKRVNRLALRKFARAVLNPQPVFTETYKLNQPGGNQPYTLISNSGGVLSVRISDLPQVAQYSGLYQKYRILKATFICLGRFNALSADINSASYNQSIGAGNAGMSRLVMAVNDSPAQVVPANETQVLTNNGCKIYDGKPKVVISCRPVPNTADANGNLITMPRQYIQFNVGGPDIPHFGIAWWHTMPFLGAVMTAQNDYEVYVKLTFQLADPR